MAKMTPLAIGVNVASVVTVLVLVTYAAHSFLAGDAPDGCSKYYPEPLEFSLKSESGEVSTPMELEARFGRDAWGVLENVEVVPALKKDAPAPELLQVKLFKKPGAKTAPEDTAGGAGFAWQPAEMGARDSACLSYSVMLSKQFIFGDGGVLPGLYGGERLDPKTEVPGKNGIASLVRWNKAGRIGLQTHAISEKGGEKWSNEPTQLVLPLGKWVDVEQEIVLNAPGKSNGALRLWIDGELVVERAQVNWRKDEEIRIAGVAADVTYTHADAAAPADKTGAIRLSPFSMRWQ